MELEYTVFPKVCVLLQTVVSTLFADEYRRRGLEVRAEEEEMGLRPAGGESDGTTAGANDDDGGDDDGVAMPSQALTLPVSSSKSSDDEGMGSG